MLKTRQGDKLWLVTQPDHAQVAGYLAAHWGNDAFARPGHYGRVPDPERLRAEVILAVAQHDNGWLEWEAIPTLAQADGFPAGLAEVLTNQREGMRRWRVGLSRFDDRPYVNLLISHHAYWLYTAKLHPAPDSEFLHSLFWKGSPEKLFPGKREEAVEFVSELETLRRKWVEELRADETTASWVDPVNLDTHGRLLQLLDGMSLSLSSALVPARNGHAKGLGQDEFELTHVPRRSWEDRVTIDVLPQAGRRIVLDPYPFDMDPLPVGVPTRVFDLPAERSAHFATWWNAQPVEMLEFQCSSK